MSDQRSMAKHPGAASDRNAIKGGALREGTPRESTLRKRTAVQPAANVQIVCADSRLADEYRAELDRGAEPRSCAVVSSPAEARRIYEQVEQRVTLLDESAVPAENSLEAAVALLAETAPVVVAAPERRWELTFLVTSGAADFVPRSGSFVAVAAARVEQRVRLAPVGSQRPIFPGDEFAGDFGEIFRHEINNELTGILGNAELLLLRRDRLPPDAVERLETIAQLAVRVRETVRRLSHAWDLWQRRPRSAPPPQPAAPPLAEGSYSVTNPSRSNDARRSTTGLASVPRMPLLRLGTEPPGPETRPGAAAAQWDKTWRTRKG